MPGIQGSISTKDRDSCILEISRTRMKDESCTWVKTAGRESDTHKLIIVRSRMRTVVLLPTGNNSVDLDSTATALNSAVRHPTDRGSKHAQFTLNCSTEM